MMAGGTFYSCGRHTWSGSEPCQDCAAEQTDAWRARSTSYDLLRRQYDELVADNGRLLNRNAAVETENARLRAALEEIAEGCGHARCHAHRFFRLADKALR